MSIGWSGRQHLNSQLAEIILHCSFLITNLVFTVTVCVCSIHLALDGPLDQVQELNLEGHRFLYVCLLPFMHMPLDRVHLGEIHDHNTCFGGIINAQKANPCICTSSVEAQMPIKLCKGSSLSTKPPILSIRDESMPDHESGRDEGFEEIQTRQ